MTDYSFYEDDLYKIEFYDSKKIDKKYLKISAKCEDKNNGGFVYCDMGKIYFLDDRYDLINHFVNKNKEKSSMKCPYCNHKMNPFETLGSTLIECDEFDDIECSNCEKLFRAYINKIIAVVSTEKEDI